MQISINEITKDEFDPYGTVIEKPQVSAGAGGPGWKYWGGLARMEAGDGSISIGLLDLNPGDLQFDWTERHMHTEELLVPIGGDCLICVAPPDHMDQPQQMPVLERFRVFRVRLGQAVLFRKGVWHGAPVAIDHPLNALLIKRSASQPDKYLNRFEDTPIKIKR